MQSLVERIFLSNNWETSNTRHETLHGTVENHSPFFAIIKNQRQDQLYVTKSFQNLDHENW